MTVSKKTRDNLPAAKVGQPSTGKYPMPDKAHAANAKARATQQVNAGNLTPSAAATVKAKANKILKGKGK